jgi:hypothetical protein
MYKSKLAVAIKHNGKILREDKDLVKLPFGSEFSVFVKNLNSRRAKFKLQIDGQDVLDGTELIVNANSEVEVKRFIRNGNMNEGNAFKFIERTQAIEDGPRGIKVDDGIVRVEFWFEKEVPETNTTYHKHVWLNDYNNINPLWNTRFGNGPYYGAVGSSSTDSAAKGILRGVECTTTSQLASTTSADAVVNDVGITAPGSKVEQKFQAVYGFNAESQSSVIVIRLAGRTGKTEVVVPVTVKTKQKCTTCGHVNKATAKFCGECGTSLELV